MSKKRNDVSPFCSVRGCRTKQPHSDDPFVKLTMQHFSSDEDLTGWVFAAMSELRASIIRDIEEGRPFAWHSRMRQPEELYIRTLYLLFVAVPEEVPHIMSGEQPNDLTSLYRKVNELIFEGRGPLEVPVGGSEYKPSPFMKTLNNSAHASFPALFLAIAIAKDGLEDGTDMTGYVKHLTTMCDRLHYAWSMFKGGRMRSDVLGGLINMYKPESYWREQSAKAVREASGAQES